MEKYDGWTLKNCIGRTPFLCYGYFHSTRAEVIKDFEENTELSWEKERRLGDYKIVKVKLAEVA